MIKQIVSFVFILFLAVVSKNEAEALPCQDRIKPEVWQSMAGESIEKQNEFFAELEKCSSSGKDVQLAIDTLAVTGLKSLQKKPKDQQKPYADFLAKVLLINATAGFEPSQHNYAAIHNAEPGSIEEKLIPQDYPLFIKWTRKAASNGEPRALLNLAIRMSTDKAGSGVPKDLKTAYRIICILEDTALGEIMGLVSVAKNDIKQKFNEREAKSIEADHRLDYATLEKGLVVPGFDCANASTDVEKLICGNESLSDLDRQASAYYEGAMSFQEEKDKGILKKDQLQWLKSTNKNISGKKSLEKKENELKKSYAERVSYLKKRAFEDPFADKELTCEEMKKFPETIFGSKDIDLGTGFGSPLDVDYSCDGSLASLEFMTKILAISDNIRKDGNVQLCSGSAIHAYRRGFSFDLLKAGMAPDIFFRQSEEIQEGAKNHTSLLSSPSSYYPCIINYMKEWAIWSIENMELYDAYMREYDKALPLLSEYYRKKFGKTKEQAEAIAKHAVMIPTEWAAGWSQSGSSAPIAPEVELSMNKSAGIEDLKKVLEEKIHESTLNAALKYALYYQKPHEYLSLLISKLEKIDNGKESALFFALHNLENTEFMLKKGANVNYRNPFGKTPVFFAIEFNAHKIVELLIKYGANVNHAYNSKTENEALPDYDVCYYYIQHTKRTPLMHAAQHADVEMIKLLIKAGAKKEAVDEPGWNALDYAVMGEKNENIEYLKSIGLKKTSNTNSDN